MPTSLARLIPLPLLLSCALQVAVAAPAPVPFSGADLFALEYAADPQIRPDGSAVAYTRVGFEIMHDRSRRSLWLVDVQSGEQWPLASSTRMSYASPRWSPDGERLVYVAAGDDGLPQLMVHWLKQRSSSRLAELTRPPGDLSWSPDGRWIAFTMQVPAKPEPLGSAPSKPEGAQWAEPLQVYSEIQYRSDDAGYLEPGHTQVFVVSADGGAPRQLTDGAYLHSGPLAWSPDGRTLLFAGNRREGWQRDPLESELYELRLADGSIRALTTRKGPDRVVGYSPDGRRVAVLGFEDRLLGYQNVELSVLDLDGGQSRSLTAALDRSIDGAAWSADGRSLYVSYEDHGAVKLARVGLDGKLTPVAANLGSGSLDRPYVGGSFSVANDGSVAHTTGTALRPNDVALTDRKGNTRRLTDLNEGLFAARKLAQTRPLAVTSSFDGRPIEAWLTTPPDFDPSRKYPLILEIHGGPMAAYGPQFATDYQLYAAAGYLVLAVNPRGSTSYGAEFANLIHHRYPSEDYDDLMSAVDAAIREGFVDADNLFVTGGSGGGVLTAWIVGRNQRFAAAVSQKPVINWASTALTTDITGYMTKYWFPTLPWEDPQAYWARSPLSLVGSVKTPTMVLTGERDYRTPFSDSEQYYQALQLAGVPTALVKVPGASHGGLTARPSQSAAKASTILAWFDRYRRPAPLSTPGR
jgi:dipeptidyl aminopeptidase/acylaminoacyl peptidase